MKGVILAGYNPIGESVTAIISVWNEIEMDLVWLDEVNAEKTVSIAQRPNDLGWRADQIEQAIHSYIFVEKK